MNFGFLRYKSTSPVPVELNYITTTIIREYFIDFIDFETNMNFTFKRSASTESTKNKFPIASNVPYAYPKG